MINRDSLPDVLATLGFHKHRNTWEKTFGHSRLAIDFAKSEIIYPESEGLMVNERQTCNFSASENFVVFECVHRLLEKGYRPEHIELEPKWKLGHGASGGRADILIKDNSGKALLIIECKIPGREFERAWHATRRDGDQLFSYAQQISETQFLCLYTSDFADGTLTYTSNIIAHRDNQKYLDENTEFLGFKDVTDVKDRFKIWRDTYKLDYTTKGIFEDGIQPYHIGKDKYSLADLHPIAESDQQGKYHQFATILRQHNVSGRENAFDKLVNLLLCKLVDEASNPKDLKFYWKGVAYDTHFDLFDRLQQLYQAGMKKFLGEDITYIDQGTVRNAMRFIRQNPDATQKAVWQLFLQQKFFTNNDFSFIDVHNERLFYQNADVLLKLLQMWQDIRLTGNHQHNQFLGDLFEGFLDQGVKQSEGQYFTPGPICRFILMSLPLESLLTQHGGPFKAIDYACGAGHFLTELALQLRAMLPPDTKLPPYHKGIYGIEKEYRLSKVAKVSAFMYGQRDIHICYGDGLVQKHAAFPGIHDKAFNLLVANPPYSVRGFLETLPETDRVHFELTETVNDAETANSIETFFVERAKQLLATGGVAGVILPASILSNGGSSYVRVREIILRYFDIVAIAEFGSGTFGKTGTNTVTLFLRRKPNDPDTAAHYAERVAEWFGSDVDQPTYRDAHLIDAYAAHVGVAVIDYKTLLQGRPNTALRKHEMFAQYRNAFDGSTVVASTRKTRAFKALPKSEQTRVLDEAFVKYAQAVERDKLLYFVLASDQSNPVLVIRSPTETKARECFLGYKWSSSKGDEGIKLVKDAHGRHLTPLYNEADRNDPTKLNRLIADNFNGTLGTIPPALAEFAGTIRLVDMLDFTRVEFEKQLSLSARSTSLVSTRYPVVTLGSVANVLIGGTPARKNSKFFTGKNPWVSISEMDGGIISDTKEKITDAAVHASNVKLVHKGTTLLSFKLSIGKTAVAGCDLYTNEAIAALVPLDKEQLDDQFLFQLFNARYLALDRSGNNAFGKSLNSKFLREEVQIPLPPLLVQAQVVTQCGAVDAEVVKAKAARDKALASIQARVAAIYASQAPRQSVDSLATLVQYGLNEKLNETGTGYRCFRMNEIARGRMVDGGSMKCADISATEFAKYKLNRGDLLLIRSNGSLDNIGKVGIFGMNGDYCFASYLVRVAPDSSKVEPHFLAAMLGAEPSRRRIESLAVKSGGTNNLSASKMKDIKVPVPPLAAQKKFVALVEQLEQQITDAEAIITAAPARKNAILAHHL